MNHIHANKSLGQNFLTDPRYRERIAKSVGATAGETVIEIGPGPGALTAELLELGIHVIAVEKDERMQEPLGALATRFPNQLTVNYEDALRTRWAALGPTPVTLCGNLPYNVGTQLVIDALQTRGKFKRMVFLLQKEVVGRITASAGEDDWGRLAVFCQLHANCRKLFEVPPGAFTPAPKVEAGTGGESRLRPAP
jgi:16S rRNA (adenine1518-N6/adenine1519-N6)-dimethyltransferase